VEGVGELPPGEVGAALQRLLQVPGKKDQPSLRINRHPVVPGRWIGMRSVGGWDDAVEQVPTNRSTGWEANGVE
jgi:hypothetical protein